MDLKEDAWIASIRRLINILFYRKTFYFLQTCNGRFEYINIIL